MQAMLQQPHRAPDGAPVHCDDRQVDVSLAMVIRRNLRQTCAQRRPALVGTGIHHWSRQVRLPTGQLISRQSPYPAGSTSRVMAGGFIRYPDAGIFGAPVRHRRWPVQAALMEPRRLLAQRIDGLRRRPSRCCREQQTRGPVPSLRGQIAACRICSRQGVLRHRT